MMLCMNRIIFAISLLLACANFDSGSCASAQQPSSTSIVGRWRSLETSKGGLGSIIEFRSDGTVDFGIGAIVEMPWRIENNQLILPSETNGGAERKTNLKWLGDNKLSLVSEAAVIELARVGDPANAGNPILGEWIENRKIEGRNFEAHYLFYPGGKLLFLMPFVTQHASYTVSGSTLHIIMPDPKPKSISDLFELSDNLLTLSESGGGHKDRYARY
jgi:hypothetical protein